MKNTKTPAKSQAVTLEMEIGLLARECVAKLLNASRTLEFDVDSRDYKPVLLLTSGETVAGQKVDDIYDLMSMFQELNALTQAAERVTELPTPPARLGMMNYIREIAKEADTVLDCGVHRTPVEQLVTLLEPFVGQKAKDWLQRVREAQEKAAAQTQGA